MSSPEGPQVSRGGGDDMDENSASSGGSGGGGRQGSVRAVSGALDSAAGRGGGGGGEAGVGGGGFNARYVGAGRTRVYEARCFLFFFACLLACLFVARRIKLFFLLEEWGEGKGGGGETRECGGWEKYS